MITATHQSVLPQNKRMVFGFIISNHEEVAEMLRENDVRLNLSGHIHMQHIASDEKQDKTDENSYSIKGAGLTDIATGSMAAVSYTHLPASNLSIYNAPYVLLAYAANDKCSPESSATAGDKSDAVLTQEMCIRDSISPSLL